MKKNTTMSLVAIILIAFGIWAYTKTKPVNQQPNEKVALAQCLSEEGAIFYGAFWCPHCIEQKRTFGARGIKDVVYIECSTPDRKGQTEACIEAEIKSYPTWRFVESTDLALTRSEESADMFTYNKAETTRELSAAEAVELDEVKAIIARMPDTETVDIEATELIENVLKTDRVIVFAEGETKTIYQIKNNQFSILEVSELTGAQSLPALAEASGCKWTEDEKNILDIVDDAKNATELLETKATEVITEVGEAL